MRWDSTKRRYVDSFGKPIPPSQVRKEVIGYIDQEKASTKKQAERLMSGDITLVGFFYFMDQRIEAWHTVTGAIAYGGKSRLGKTQQSRIKSKIDSEQKYLNEFKEQTKKSFVAARAIASQVADQVTSQPIKALSRKLTGSLKHKVEKRIYKSLIDAAPSEAEAVARRAVVEELGDEGEILSSVINVAEDLAASLIGGTIVSRSQMYPDAAYATFQNEVAARESDSGVTLGRRLCVEDNASCEECVAAAQASEEFVPLDELEEIGSLQCLNNCVVAGTMMGGRFYGGLKALYSGEIINLRTASGKELSITPNHPVLTDRGFIFAGQLNEGDNLISESGESEPRSTLYNHQQPPAAVEQILTSLGEFGIRGRIGRGLVNLNGDERAFNGEVNVVWAYGVLSDRNQPLEMKRVRKVSLPFAAHGKASAFTDGLRALNGFRYGFAANRSPCGGGLTLRGLQALPPREELRLAASSDCDSALQERLFNRLSGNTGQGFQFQHASTRLVASDCNINVHSSPDKIFALGRSKGLSFGQCADVNVALYKPAAEDIRADAAFLSEIRKSFPGLVTSDPVVEISRTMVTDVHVYDLSTDVGWQSANGIIISNCRCEFEFQIGGEQFATSDVFQGVVSGQDAYGGDVVIQ